MKHADSEPLFMRLAHAFGEIMHRETTDEQLREIVRRNREETNPSVCHSHDFADANEWMAEAFGHVMHRAVDLQSDEDNALWNDAWTHARLVDFYYMQDLNTDKERWAMDANTIVPNEQRATVVRAYAHSIMQDILTDVALGAALPTVVTGDENYGILFEETFLQGHAPQFSVANYHKPDGEGTKVLNDALMIVNGWLRESRNA